MEPTAATACRDVLNRLRTQVLAHLPAAANTYNGPTASEVVPLDRLPMIGSVVQQYIEAEAVYAQATQQGGLGEQSGSESGG